MDSRQAFRFAASAGDRCWAAGEGWMLLCGVGAFVGCVEACPKSGGEHHKSPDSRPVLRTILRALPCPRAALEDFMNGN
jgi:hypothetical protein